MSRLRWGFKSPNNNNGNEVVLSPQKDIPVAVNWDSADVAEVPEKGKDKEVERLWGFENFGNTCYCNSVLQSLYFCAPFREFVESYPDILPPQIPLGPPPDKMITTPLSPGSGPHSNSRPGSPLTTVKSNPFDYPTTSNGVPILPVSPTVDKPATKEKRSWSGLGRKPTIGGSSAPPLPTVQQGQVSSPSLDPPTNKEAQAAEPELDPNMAPPTVFATIQTLFSHMNTSPPHQPLPSKKPTDQTNANVSATALATANGNTLPNASLTATGGTTPGANGNLPPPPPLLASLPPPSAPRGGGPFQAGTLGRGVIRPEDLLRTVKRENEMFRGMAQQDAHEFLGWMLNRVAEEVEQLDKEKKHKTGSGEKLNGKTFVQNLFEGALTNETRCLSCETTSSRDEAFLDLSIDIEQHTSVTACLRQFSASEMLCQKNKFFCETCCGLQEAEKRMKIKRLPNVLALHLKRFKYQENLGRYVKLSYRVPFPTQLRLPNTSDDAEDPDRLYELFAVVIHIGNGPHHGHYVAIVKSGGRWVMCDDENIEPIEESDIPRYFGDYPSGAGYVLFYQAVDLDLAGLGLKTPSPKAEAADIIDLADLSISDPEPAIQPEIEVTTPFTPVSESVPAAVEDEDPFADTPAQPHANGQNGFSITPPLTSAENQFIQPRAYRSPSRSTTGDSQSADATSPKLGKDNGGNWFKRGGKDKAVGPPPITTRGDSGETVTPTDRAPTTRQPTTAAINSNANGSTTFGGLGLTINSTVAGDGARGVMGVASPVQNGVKQAIPAVQASATPTESSPAAMSSSVISSYSASSGNASLSGTSVPPTPQQQAGSVPLAAPLPVGTSSGLGIGRRESKKERVPSGASASSTGGSLGRRLSGMTRSGSMAFKMGFGKNKDKDKE